jgi:hypothetical protein
MNHNNTKNNNTNIEVRCKEDFKLPVEQATTTTIRNINYGGGESVVYNSNQASVDAANAKAQKFLNEFTPGFSFQR